MRYHARDTAVMRGRIEGCPVLLGSATPSLESWRHAVEGRYRHLRLPNRVTPCPPPRIEIIDLRGKDIEAGGGLSPRSIEAMRANFAARRPDPAVPEPPRLRALAAVLGLRPHRSTAARAASR